MRWAIEIQKTSLDERMLSDILGVLNINLVEGINFPKAFSSSEIDECPTAQDAIEIARRVRSTLKTTQIDPEFSLGAVINFSVDPPTSHYFLEVDSLFINVSTFFPATLTVSSPNGLSPDEKEQWIKDHNERQYQIELDKQLSKLIPASYNSNALKVIELLSVEPLTTSTLWKIYELVRNGKDNDHKIQKQFGISEVQLSRFKDSVHNPLVSGDNARHALPGKLLSTNPMSKMETEEFIRNLAKKWLTRIRKEYEESRK